MERKYKFYMLCRDAGRQTPFLRADGSPLITTAVNEREAWNKFKNTLEARFVTPDFLCEVDLVPVKNGASASAEAQSAASSDSKVELDSAMEGLANVLREQGKLVRKSF